MPAVYILGSYPPRPHHLLVAHSANRHGLTEDCFQNSLDVMLKAHETMPGVPHPDREGWGFVRPRQSPHDTALGVTTALTYLFTISFVARSATPTSASFVARNCPTIAKQATLQTGTTTQGTTAAVERDARIGDGRSIIV